MPASFRHLTDRRVIYSSLLARWKDGLYYTAVLTKCDRANKRCRVCFEDGSEIWVSTRDLHIQLTLDQSSEDEDIVCCICDDGTSEPPNEIILCDVCQQGYHQRCHQPPVDASKLDDSDDTKDHKDWFCATCSFILNQTNQAKLSATVAANQHHQNQQHDRATRANSSTPSSSKQHQQQPQPQQSTQVDVKVPAVPSDASQPPSKPNKQATPQQTVIAAPVRRAPTPPPAEKTVPIKQAATPKQPPKVKQTPSPHQQLGPQQKPTIGAVKSDVGQHQRSAPYYPLSSQARAMATSSTAALASLTASSALVVGSSAGRTKQDLVKQSNRSTQRQINNETTGTTIDTGHPVPKHAVRKSSVNFSASPVKQSALPTATRSSPAGVATITVAKSSASPPAVRATVAPKPVITMSAAPSVTTTPSQAPNSSYTIVALTNQSRASGGAGATMDDPSKIRTSHDGGPTMTGLVSPARDEKRSVVGVQIGSQPASRPSMSLTCGGDLRSDASSCISLSSGASKEPKSSGPVRGEHSISGGISSGSPANRTQPQTADGPGSSIDSGNGPIESSSNSSSGGGGARNNNNTDNKSSNNKSTAMVVGANVD